MHFPFSTTTLPTHEEICALGDALRKRNWTISCAESCTGGGLAYTFTQVAGSSDWFRQSWVTYSNDAKHDRLGVSTQTLEHFGAVSAETVEEMVSGVARIAESEVAISVSGVAGPGGGSAEKPVGLVWFGFYLNGEIVTEKQQFDGSRQHIREQAIAYALRFVFQWLNN
ncbi:CinA family protein [Alteromonas sp. CYL-A6]|uniref:CinA family protein n=1 Tax=Alteromonas nitratireducens TaxID=3390813 RepID=UPI0034B63B6E